MSLQSNKLQAAPVSRKRATVVLALGAYVNTGVLIVQGLLLVPLYLHFIGAHLYGLWLASGGILGMLAMMNFGISSMLIQRVARAYGQSDLPKAGAYFINGMLVYLIIAAIFTLAGILISFSLPLTLKASAGSEVLLIHCFQIATLATGLGIINECLRGFAQALLRPLFSMIAMIVIRILGIAITVSLLYRQAGLWALPLAMLITEGLLLVAGLIQAISLFRDLRAKVQVDAGIVKEYFQIGGALFMARLGHVLSRESDPLLITFFMRPEVTTAYMLTRRAADIVSQLLSVIYGATHSAFSHLAGQGHDAKTGEMATRFMTIVFLLGLVGFVSYVGMNHAFVALWVGKGMALDQDIILFIGIAFFATNLRNVVLQTLNGLGDFEFSSRVIFLEGLGRVVLSGLLLSIFGVIGVPLSLGVAGLASTIVLSMKLKGDIQLKFDRHGFLKAMALMFVLFGLAEMVAHFYASAGTWLMFVLQTGGLLLMTLIIYILFGWGMFREIIKGYPIWKH